MVAETYARTRDQLVLVKMQSGANAAATPAVGADEVRVGAPTFNPAFDSIDTNYVQGSLSESAPVTGGGNVSMQLPTFLTGAGTAGTAPDYGRLLRACAMSETLTAADVTDTAQDGTTTSITLDSGASAVNDAYKGMVVEITDGTGEGQRAVITGYVGSTKVAALFPTLAVALDDTSVYAIRANALYRPITSAQELLTIWGYQHRNSGNSRLRKMFDAAGTFTMQVAPKGIASLSTTFTGRLVETPTDVSHPAAPTFESVFPPPLLLADSYLGDGKIKFSDFQFDIANTVQQFADPTDQFGMDYAMVTARKSTVQITPNLTLLSSRNAFADWIASTQRSAWLNWGGGAGKNVSLYVPAIQYTGFADADVNDLVGEQLSARSVSPDGEIFICVW